MGTPVKPVADSCPWDSGLFCLNPMGCGGIGGCGKYDQAEAVSESTAESNEPSGSEPTDSE